MSATTGQVHQFQARACSAPRCQSTSGWQCAECGHYYSRNQVVDLGGEYYCRSRMGHNRTGKATV